MGDVTPDQGTETEHLERMFARGLVIAGGVFWMIAAFAGPYVYDGTSLVGSIKTAMWPFLAVLVILVIGWSYERLAAELLFAASAAVIVWGALYAWEMGVWVIMTFVLILPTAAAGILFLLASRAEARRTATARERQPVSTGPFEVPRATEAYVRSR